MDQMSFVVSQEDHSRELLFNPALINITYSYDGEKLTYQIPEKIEWPNNVSEFSREKIPEFLRKILTNEDYNFRDYISVHIIGKNNNFHFAQLKNNTQSEDKPTKKLFIIYTRPELIDPKKVRKWFMDYIFPLGYNFNHYFGFKKTDLYNQIFNAITGINCFMLCVGSHHEYLRSKNIISDSITFLSRMPKFFLFAKALNIWPVGGLAINVLMASFNYKYYLSSFK